MRRTYVEKFETGPGGWFGWVSNHAGPKALEWSPGALTSRSPWWIDYNHAPPGAGYLHMLFALLTAGAGHGESLVDAGGVDRLFPQRQPPGLRRARGNLRMRGGFGEPGAPPSLLARSTPARVT